MTTLSSALTRLSAQSTWQRLPIAAMMGWAAILLASYYKQIWILVAGGPVGWSRGMHEFGPPALFVAASLLVLMLLFSGTPWYRLTRLLEAGYQSALFVIAVLIVLVLLALALSAHLPSLQESAWRGVDAVFGTGIIFLAAQVLGTGICSLLRWKGDNWREELVYRTSTGLGAISYLSLGLALAGLYQPHVVQGGLALILLAGVAWLCLHTSALSSISNAAVNLLRTRECPKARIWKAVAVFVFLIALVGALAPEIEYDALWYHLWLPKLWLEAGHPVDPFIEYVSLYPMTFELLYGGAMTLGGPVAAKLLHWSCLPLTALIVYEMTRRYLPRASPWLAVCLFVTIPTVLWEATTAYVDLALTFYVTLALYALTCYIQGKSRRCFVLAALNLGMAMAIKQLGLFVLLIFDAGLVLTLWFQQRDIRRALVPPMALGLIALLFPLPWYIRNWLASGNPVFPDLYGLFGAFPPERWSAISQAGLEAFQAHFGYPRTLLNLLLLPWNMTVHAASFGGTLGPLFLLLLPALALIRRRSSVLLWLISFPVLYIALWALPIGSFQMRFLAPITPVLAVLGAAAYSQLEMLFKEQLPLFAAKSLKVGLVLLLVLNLPWFISVHESDREGWNNWLTHVLSHAPFSVVFGREGAEEYLARSVPSYSAWQYINTNLPTGARVLSFSGGDQLYSARDRLSSDATIANPAVWGAPVGREAEAFANLKQLGITHILFDKRQLALLDPGALAIASSSAIGRWYRKGYEDWRFVLYEIKWERVTF